MRRLFFLFNIFVARNVKARTTQEKVYTFLALTMLICSVYFSIYIFDSGNLLFCAHEPWCQAHTYHLIMCVCSSSSVSRKFAFFQWCFIHCEWCLYGSVIQFHYTYYFFHALAYRLRLYFVDKFTLNIFYI